MVLFWNIIDLWNLANYKWPNIQLDNPGKVSNEQQFQVPSKMVLWESPQKKHSIEGPQDPNGSGNSFRWTEVFGPFRVHMYCPKIVLWQRPQSYLEGQNLLCKKKYRIHHIRKKYVELMFDGKSNIYSVMWTQLHIYNWITAVFGNLATPNIHVEIGLLTDVSIGCYQFSTWTMVVSCFITLFLYIYSIETNACGLQSTELFAYSSWTTCIFLPNMLFAPRNSGDFGTAPGDRLRFLPSPQNWGLHLEVVEVCLQGCFSHHLTSAKNV